MYDENIDDVKIFTCTVFYSVLVKEEMFRVSSHGVKLFRTLSEAFASENTEEMSPGYYVHIMPYSQMFDHTICGYPL